MPRRSAALVAPPARRGAAARARRRDRAPGPAAARRRAGAARVRDRRERAGRARRRRSAPTRRPAPTASPSSSTRRPALSLRVHQLHALRAALHDHPRAALRPRADQRWRASRCAPPARPSTARRPTGASTPSPTPARPADRSWRSSTATVVRSPPATRSPRRSRGSRAARSSPSRGWAVSTSSATRATPPRWRALRARKTREEKPFAVMVAGLAASPPLAEVGAAEAALLCSRERPIVLLRKRAGTDDALPGVAPGLAWLGAMLPYTPLQLLLFHEAAGRPAGTAWLDAAQPLVLVMTSANPGGEPLVTGNDEALARLAGIADAWLVARPRHRDPLRRQRAARDSGRAGRRRAVHPPRARLHAAGDSACRARGRRCVALGGHFKNTVCVTRGAEAFVTQHVGDLDNAPTCTALEDSRRAPRRHARGPAGGGRARPASGLLQHPPRGAARRTSGRCRRFAVQHHHAHVAAVLAEHRVDGPVLGLALDGVGLGSDGTAWGGELLLVDGARCERARAPASAAAARRRPRGARAVADGGRGAPRWPATGRAIARRFADEPAAACRRRDARARLQRARDQQPRAAGSTPPPACSACAAGWPSRARPRCCSRASPRRTARWPPTPRCSRIRRGQRARPAAAGAAPGRRARPRLRRGAVPRHAGRRRSPNGRTAPRRPGRCPPSSLRRRLLPQRDPRRAACGASSRRAASRLLEARAVPPNDGGLALGQAWVALQSLTDR